jgi:hypothetical protein
LSVDLRPSAVDSPEKLFREDVQIVIIQRLLASYRVDTFALAGIEGESMYVHEAV